MEATADDLLSFKEFPLIEETSGSSAQININSPQRTTASSAIETHDDTATQDSSSKPASILSFEYYQQFFDVDTMTVVDRIATAMVPKRAPANYLKLNIASNPDMYGPIWIVLTLIFTIAISGNMASYLQHTGNHHWRYSYHLVSYSATAIILYTVLVPTALWAILKWSAKPVDLDIEEDAPRSPSLLSLICVYGYSLAIYIPVSVFWTVQVSLIQWLLVITGAFLSSFALLTVLIPAIKKSRYSLFIVLAIELAHFALAAGFMLYFFHAPETEAPVEKSSLTKTTVSIASVVVNTTMQSKKM
ncbi:protein YIPF1 isoform X2 [Anopheles bellator]|uniref:protein YIPF1 isoform X2 n=1 Tax=Anopheles bellator TaxID=139047 RepID=UPI0026471602|nr:protein YIPF1 isoform X2 [Anopheles bellator]